jgi:glutamate synthase (NADPH/NADH) small chain
VLGINEDPVTIERIEYEIAERAWDEGWVTPQVPTTRTGRTVAVVGSGPAGLAAAQQLARAGHWVTVFERAEKPGGLLRYGIPEFKMEKAVLDRRLAQMEAEGVTFVCSTSVGGTESSGPGSDGAGAEGPLEPGQTRGLGEACAPDVRVRPAEDVRAAFDAVVLAGGATLPRDLIIPGRDLAGIHLAMEYLKPSNLVRERALAAPPINAKGKRVVIIGGGDTGADCLGTAHRQGAASVHQLEIMAEPPAGRAHDNPWPQWPVILRSSAAHEEGGRRLFAVTTTEFVDDASGAVRALRGYEVEMRSEDGRPVFEEVPGTEFELECELVLLAMGFLGTERRGAVDELGVDVGPRGTVVADENWSTNVEGVFVCGDQARGQSLIVWAIAEGRSCAAAVDRWLMGTTSLPAPIEPGQLAMR